MLEQQRIAEAKKADAVRAAESAQQQGAIARIKDTATRMLASACGRAVTAGLWAQRAHEAARRGAEHEAAAAIARAEATSLERVRPSVLCFASGGEHLISCTLPRPSNDNISLPPLQGLIAPEHLSFNIRNTHAGDRSHRAKV